eukprot:SAG11_NODE_305_length_10996_cov_4.698082_13_plen_102_part_00
MNLFNGTEKFAISILPEPESKRNATQVRPRTAFPPLICLASCTVVPTLEAPIGHGQGVITLVKFTASKMELDADFIELVVEPTMTCDELRARIAELDSSFG